MLMVNHAEEKINIGDKILICKPGESLKSLETWARRWNWTKSKVKRFLEILQKDDMICLQNEKITTRITINNWDTYQGNRNGNETHLKRIWNADETHLKPNKNVKKEKKDISSTGVDVYTPLFEKFWSLQSRKVGKWDAFLQWKKACKLLNAEKIIAAWELQRPFYEKRLNEKGTDFPHPRKWLYDRRWQDDPKTLMGDSKPKVELL